MFNDISSGDPTGIGTEGVWSVMQLLLDPIVVVPSADTSDGIFVQMPRHAVYAMECAVVHYSPIHPRYDTIGCTLYENNVTAPVNEV